MSGPSEFVGLTNSGTVVIDGGLVGGEIFTTPGSVTTIRGGQVGYTDYCEFAGTLNMSGGEFAADAIVIAPGGTLQLAGGQLLGDVHLDPGSLANLLVTDLVIDGLRIELVAGQTAVLAQRVGLLEATLVDGSIFSRQLNGGVFPTLYVYPGATLSATLVPTPSTLALLITAGLFGSRRRR